MTLRVARNTIGLLVAATIAAGIFVSPAKSAQSAASIPDFSRFWRHQSLPGFEPLASGPTSLTNRSRRNGVSDYNQLVGDYTNPILKPEAAESREEARRAFVGRRDLSEPGQPVLARARALHFQEFRHDDAAAAARGHDPLRRGSGRPPRAHEPAASRKGDAVLVWRFGGPLRRRHAGDRHRGHQDRPALCHARSVRHALHKGAARGGTLPADRLRSRARRVATGRKRRINASRGTSTPTIRGKFLQVTFTVEDEGVFTTPWTATITYRPARDPWQEIVCAENTHEYYYNKESDVPTADRPDF